MSATMRLRIVRLGSNMLQDKVVLPVESQHLAENENQDHADEDS